VDELLPIDHRILGALVAYRGPEGICPSLARLAEDLGVTRRYVRQRLAVLEDVGLVERVPVFELPDDPEWQRRQRRSNHPGRRTSNSYRLTSPVPRPLGTTKTALTSPVSPAQPLGTRVENSANPVPTLKAKSGAVPQWWESVEVRDARR
jgi:DNA-binding transcriptional ArsR family regulator